MRVPPPISAGMVTEWCGAWNGGRVISDIEEGNRPATECNEVVTRAVSASRSGSIVGSREASIVLPDPGSPRRKHVVPTGGCNFHRRNCLRLTAHVGHVCESRITVAFLVATDAHPPVERSLHSISPRPTR